MSPHHLEPQLSRCLTQAGFAPPPLNVLYSDWLYLTSRRLEQQMGGAFLCDITQINE